MNCRGCGVKISEKTLKKWCPWTHQAAPAEPGPTWYSAPCQSRGTWTTLPARGTIRPSAAPPADPSFTYFRSCSQSKPCRWSQFRVRSGEKPKVQSIRADRSLSSGDTDTSFRGGKPLPSCSQQLGRWLLKTVFQQRMVGLCCPHLRGCHRRIRGILPLASAMPARGRAQPERLCDWTSCITVSQSAGRMRLREAMLQSFTNANSPPPTHDNVYKYHQKATELPLNPYQQPIETM